MIMGDELKNSLPITDNVLRILFFYLVLKVDFKAPRIDVSRRAKRGI